MAAKKPATSKSTAVAKPARAAVALPGDIHEQIRAQTEALKGRLAAPASDGIQVSQSKEFKHPDGTKNTSFKAIIVDFISFNAYYEGAYNQDNVVPPNCFAIGIARNEELVPSESSPEPQDDGKNCKGCWANAFKSADNGKGKACKQSIRLALLCEDGELHRLNISSTGLRDFGNYVRDVANQFGTPPYGVMTTFSFDDGFEFPSVRCSDPLQLDDEQLAFAWSKRDDAAAMLTQEPDVSEFEDKVVAARNKPKGRAAASGKVATGGRSARK